MQVPYRLQVLLNKLQEAGCGPIRKEGVEFRCRCPAHDDGSPSLYVGATEDKILLHCGAQCQVKDICDRLDHALSDLFFDADEPWVDADGEFSIADPVVPPAAESLQATEPKAGTTAQSEELRPVVYAELLAALELSTDHFEQLRRRGLTADEIAHRGYRTADNSKIRYAVDLLLNRYGRAELLTVPGFRERDERVIFQASRGFLIPVRDLSGHIVALKIRHDAGYNGAKYSYASSSEASCGSPVHVPLGIQAPVPTIRFTEGELKADVATILSGIPTISAPGISNWQLGIPILKALGAHKVHLAFDQDDKAGTLTIMEKALYGLTRAGFEAVLEWWDGQLGKGVDDLLAAGNQPQTMTGMEAALRVRDALHAPEPEKAVTPEPEPDPFPVEVFPPVLAVFCHEAAAATSTPPDYAGFTMLITGGAAIGTSRALCLKEHVWYESPRFYGGNVGDPASGKTPAMDAVVKPYQALQLRLLKEYKNAHALYDAAKADYEKTVKENRALPEDQCRPLPLVPPEPKLPERFVVMDATVESLAPILEANPRGLLMAQDEGVAWVRGMGQYKGGRGNDRQFWLSNWSGKSHLVDRKTQGNVPVSIPRPFINVICGIPPEMLNELADYQGRNDGFLHRILFVFPKATTGADWSEVTLSKDSKEVWETTLTRLRKLAMKELEDGVLGYQTVKFSPAGKEAWIAWWNAHAAEIRDPALPAQLIGPWGKLKACAARLALVLHYLWLVQTDQDESDLDVASVERAIRLIHYFKNHLRLVYSRLRQTPEDNRLLEVIDWIRQQGGRCTARDLVRAKKVTPTAQAKKMLAELEERGYGRIEWHEAKNNKRVPWFIFDPM
jgi:hypothetical protein